MVPTFCDSEFSLNQSLAIIEYLDECYPQPALLPVDSENRAKARALALDIACDIHPINNLRVLKYLKREFGISHAQKDAWYRHWVEEGLAAVEAMLAVGPPAGPFCHGEVPGMADCCLVPQVFNARRFDCRMDHLPNVTRIVAACEALDAFRAAAPENQSDAE